MVAADTEDSAYDIASKNAPTVERRAMDANLVHERKQEEAREQREREAEARAATERQAALAARPYPVRLLEQRCTARHAETHYRQQAHTWPGWLFVALRMKYLNGASINNAELATIITRLAAEHPTDRPDAALEYASLLATAGLLVGLIWFARQRRRKRG